MRLTTGLVAACTIASFAAVPVASAAPRPPAKVCKLIVDDKGDATSSPGGDASVDIIGGDFASNGKLVQAIIRLDKFTHPNPMAPFGQAYFATFTVKGLGDTLSLSAEALPQGDAFRFGYQADDPNTGVPTSYTIGDAKGVIDRAKSEIRIWAEVAKFPQAKSLKNGNKVTSITAEARRIFGQRVVPSQDTPAGVRVPLGGATLTYDDAPGKTYTLGAPSCVAIGK